MAKHLVLAGGGHAHLETLAHLDEAIGRGHRVTLISPDPEHYYSGMGPGLLGGSYRPEQVRFPVQRLAETAGAIFIAGRVAAIDAPGQRLLLESGDSLNYDVLSCNTGSSVLPLPTGPGAPLIFPAKPVALLEQARRVLLARLDLGPVRLLVVGGGPAGVELAGNLWRLCRACGGRAAITLASSGRLLPRQPERARRLALTSLTQRGITVREDSPVVLLADGGALFADGRSHGCDVVLLATGITPGPLFRDSGLPVGTDGALQVDAGLRCPSHPQIFGGGDCIDFLPYRLDRVGVYAVRQGPLLRSNLLAALEDRPLQDFRPQRRYLLVFNLGDRHGLLVRGRMVLDGSLTWRLKDRIDRAFMGRFQGKA
jgi:NADH dehydrogenase FAD-containing subunit